MLQRWERYSGESWAIFALTLCWRCVVWGYSGPWSSTEKAVSHSRQDIHLFLYSMKLTLLCLAQLCYIIGIAHRHQCVELGHQASWQRTALQAHSLGHAAVCPSPDHHWGTSARVVWHYQENCGSLLRLNTIIIMIFIAQYENYIILQCWTVLHCI